VSDCFRVGVEEEVEMLPYAGVRSVSIESCLIQWCTLIWVYTPIKTLLNFFVTPLVLITVNFAVHHFQLKKFIVCDCNILKKCVGKFLPCVHRNICSILT